MGPVPAAWNHLPIHPVCIRAAVGRGAGVLPTPVHIFCTFTLIYLCATWQWCVWDHTQSLRSSSEQNLQLFFFFFFFFLFLPICLSRSHHTDSQWCDHRCFALHMSTEQERGTQHFCTVISAYTSSVTPEHPALPWKDCEKQLKKISSLVVNRTHNLHLHGKHVGGLQS